VQPAWASRWPHWPLSGGVMWKRCAVCGKVFEAYHPRQQLYCSRVCKNRAWRDRYRATRGLGVPSREKRRRAPKMSYLGYVRKLVEKA